MLNLFVAACLTAGLAHDLPVTNPAKTPARASAEKPAKNPPKASATTSANSADYPRTVVSRATTLTRALAQRVQLNEGQYVQIKRLHLRYINERHELDLLLAGSPARERDERLAVVQRTYQQSLTALLQPAQRVAYQQLRASFTAHRLQVKG